MRLRQCSLGQASLQLLNHLARLLPQLLVRIVLSLNDSALKGVDLARKERSAGTMASNVLPVAAGVPCWSARIVSRTAAL